MGPRVKTAPERRVMFSVVAEGNDLVLLNGDGTEERRLSVSDPTVELFGVEGVAADLKTNLAYEMKDEQGQEDLRRG